MRRCVFPVLAVCLFTAFAQENLDGARDAMGRGVKLFQRGKYPEAAKAFERAAELSPDNVETKLYLGISYMAQFNPGSSSPANLELAHKAETQFLSILKEDPSDDTALSYMANLSYQRAMGLADPVEKQKQLDRAKGWFQELAEQVPKNKEAPLNLALIAWQEAHQRWLNARARAGMTPNDPGPVKEPAARAMLETKCAPLWDEAIRYLRHALEIDPDFDNAMGYLNVVLRERADLAGNEDDYRRQIGEADDWVRKMMELRRRKGPAPAQTGQ